MKGTKLVGLDSLAIDQYCQMLKTERDNWDRPNMLTS